MRLVSLLLLLFRLTHIHSLELNKVIHSFLMYSVRSVSVTALSWSVVALRKRCSYFSRFLVASRIAILYNTDTTARLSCRSPPIYKCLHRDCGKGVLQHGERWRYGNSEHAYRFSLSQLARKYRKRTLTFHNPRWSFDCTKFQDCSRPPLTSEGRVVISLLQLPLKHHGWHLQTPMRHSLTTGLMG